MANPNRFAPLLLASAPSGPWTEPSLFPLTRERAAVPNGASGSLPRAQPSQQGIKDNKERA